MRLGKNQLALLLIVDEATANYHGRAFTWEESIRYFNVNGEPDSFFMMATDLRSLELLVDHGLVDRSMGGYTKIYSTTAKGHALVKQLRDRLAQPRRP